MDGMTLPIRCRHCRMMLHPNFSPLDAAASRRRLCPYCYVAAQNEGNLEASVNKIRRCEHLWTDWEIADGEDATEILFARTCELCGIVVTHVGKSTPPEPEEFDISWATLDD